MTNPTDTNQASELYELCKEVYERTGWNNQELLGGWIQDQFDGPENRGTFTTRDQIETILFKLICPLYTSDYLLSKLPKFSPVAKDAYLTVMEKQTPKDKREDFYWTAGYFTGNGWGHTGQSDTPLLALLRLTIALSEAGELDNE